MCPHLGHDGDHIEELSAGKRWEPRSLGLLDPEPFVSLGASYGGGPKMPDDKSHQANIGDYKPSEVPAENKAQRKQAEAEQRIKKRDKLGKELSDTESDEDPKGGRS